MIWLAQDFTLYKRREVPESLIAGDSKLNAQHRSPVRVGFAVAAEMIISHRQTPFPGTWFSSTIYYLVEVRLYPSSPDCFPQTIKLM